MKPIYYTGTADNCKFHYKYSDLKKFLKLGFKDGNVGMIIIGHKNNMTFYKGFGTIENPCRQLQHLTFMDNPLFDGKFNPDSIVNPKISYKLTTLKFDILDFGKT